MGILYDLKNKRRPSKSIDDVLIPDGAWKPDLEIADRYQSFATELMRIALLGIAAFGFLISEVVMKQYDSYCDLIRSLVIPETIAVICFLISLACALTHRFYSTWCIYYQIQIGRGLLRFKNPGWTEQELKTEEEYLSRFRAEQRKKSAISNKILKLSTLFLIIGYTSIILVFCVFLLNFNSIKHPPLPESGKSVSSIVKPCLNSEAARIVQSCTLL